MCSISSLFFDVEIQFWEPVREVPRPEPKTNKRGKLRSSPRTDFKTGSLRIVQGWETAQETSTSQCFPPVFAPFIFHCFLFVPLIFFYSSQFFSFSCSPIFCPCQSRSWPKWAKWVTAVQSHPPKLPTKAPLPLRRDPLETTTQTPEAGSPLPRATFAGPTPHLDPAELSISGFLV